MNGGSAQSTSRERREAVVREHWDAENRHDPDGVVASFSPTCASYDIPAFGPYGQRPDAASVRELWKDMLTSFPDLDIEPGAMLHGDDHIFAEVRITGTQMGEFAGIPPTGRSIDLPRVANLFEFEGDELVCERVYIDFAEITRQLMPAEADS